MVTRDELDTFFGIVFYGDKTSETLLKIYKEEILPMISNLGFSEDGLNLAFGEIQYKYLTNADSIKVSTDSWFYLDETNSPRKDYVVIEYEHYYSGDTDTWQLHVPVDFFTNLRPDDVNGWINEKIQLAIRAKMKEEEDKRRNNIERKQNQISHYTKEIERMTKELAELLEKEEGNKQ